jgi:hypothetical protein
VKLVALRYDGEQREFVADAGTPLSAGIESCLSQWLVSIDKPPPGQLEAFDARDFLDAAGRVLAAIRARDAREDVTLNVPVRLSVPYLRTVCIACNFYTYDEILRIEPDNPWAIRDRFLHGLHQGGPTTRDPIRAAIQTARCSASSIYRCSATTWTTTRSSARSRWRPS